MGEPKDGGSEMGMEDTLPLLKPEGFVNPASPEEARATPGEIGPYRLLEPIGEGGMGEVWLAEQLEPVRRRVALKLIKAGMDTQQVVARFESERQALALMDHPAIAKVVRRGSTPEGRPYFVMEYVAGIPTQRTTATSTGSRPVRSASSYSSRSATASSTRTRRRSSTAT